MTDTNFVVLIGRLVRDAELKYTNSGKAVSRFSIAVNKKTKAGNEWKENASFFDIVLWGKLGESLQLYLTKGKQVSVTGELNQERWQQDGDNRTKVNVVAHTIQLLGDSRSSSGGGSGAEKKQEPEAYSLSAEDYGFTDDIPF